MTDPADMDGAALNEAVADALGYLPPGPTPSGHCFVWHKLEPDPVRGGSTRYAPDITGPGQWAALGLVWEECERRGWLVLFERRVVIVNMNDGDRGHLLGEAGEPDSVGGIPRALAVAFLRAVAGEGRA